MLQIKQVNDLLTQGGKRAVLQIQANVHSKHKMNSELIFSLKTHPYITGVKMNHDTSPGQVEGPGPQCCVQQSAQRVP